MAGNNPLSIGGANRVKQKRDIIISVVITSEQQKHTLSDDTKAVTKM